ncbi:MAG: type IX secretion system membrane protein PorP/SprF [Bacteroidota bacterium]
MKKTLLITSVLISIGSSVFAQQDKLITHFMYDKMSINPGETGINEGICATAIYRNQWDKVNGAPNSAVLNVAANLTRFFPGGVGISFFHDAIGFSRQNNLLLNYSFPLQIGNAGKLGIGVGLGITNFGMNPNWVPPTVNPDPTLPVGFTSTKFDLNFGLYWKGDQDYYAGLSSTHLTQSLLASTVGTAGSYQTARHYYLMGGKRFRGLFGQDGDLDANVLLRTDLVKFSADINARYIWRDMLYGGLTYRTSDAVAVMVGWKPFNDFTVGYSYDVTINKLSSVSRGSHEIMVKYCYYLPVPPITKSKHPRWL